MAGIAFETEVDAVPQAHSRTPPPRGRPRQEHSWCMCYIDRQHIRARERKVPIALVSYSALENVPMPNIAKTTIRALCDGKLCEESSDDEGMSHTWQEH